MDGTLGRGELGFMILNENSTMFVFDVEAASFPNSAKLLIINCPELCCQMNALTSTNTPTSKPGLCSVRRLGPGSKAEAEPGNSGLSG